MYLWPRLSPNANQCKRKGKFSSLKWSFFHVKTDKKKILHWENKKRNFFGKNKSTQSCWIELNLLNLLIRKIVYLKSTLPVCYENSDIFFLLISLSFSLSSSPYKQSIQIRNILYADLLLISNYNTGSYESKRIKYEKKDLKKKNHWKSTKRTNWIFFNDSESILNTFQRHDAINKNSI